MSLRYRIGLSMLSLVVLSGVISALIGAYLLWRHLGQEAENRVRQDLNTAREFYDQRLQAMEAALRYTALGERFRPNPLHVQYVKAGRLGRKVGRGVYEYPAT